jgi:hypothetical protein
MKRRKSWQEKLADSKDLPRVERVSPRQSARWGSGSFVIPAPIEVDGLMKRVPTGKLVTINEIRAALARKHHASFGCPITTGIFAWIAANAAEEAAAAGQTGTTPYWRTLKSDGQLNPKYPSGIAAARRRLRSEGHTVVKRGQNYFVKNFQSSLVNLAPD